MYKLLKRLKRTGHKISKESLLFRRIFRFSLRSYRKLKYLIFHLWRKVDRKTIFFSSYDGRKYTCSPKAIYEQLIEMDEFKDYEFIWEALSSEENDIKEDPRLKIVIRNSKQYYKELAQAKYWIVNSIVPEHVFKKKNQIYVQCWHGTPLKKLRYDIEAEGSVLNTVNEIRKRNDMDAKRFDYFISPSKYASEKFTSAFNLKKLHKNDIIIEKGYPRNDSLFNREDKEFLEIKTRLEIPFDKKIIFYAPTFRDNSHKSGLGYTYVPDIDFNLLQREFGDDYIVLYNPHYFVANKVDLSEYEGFVYNVSYYNEINDIYLIADILITDYSSVFFDYANLKKPIIFFMSDYETYKNDLRGFYISLDELPGKITKTQDELVSAIKNIKDDFEKNKDKYEIFNKKYNYLDDGNAAMRVIKEIF